MTIAIKYISLIILFHSSFNLIAQTKYEFSTTGTRSSDANVEFWGKSKNRQISVKWSKDIWLSPNEYRIDSVTKDGFIEIEDTYLGKINFLRVTPSGDTLTYIYKNDGKEMYDFSIDRSRWYSSILEEIIYPYIKATFHNRFFRNSEERITVQVGSKFPHFDKIDINNQRITSDDIKNKITTINFWNIYCAPCIKEMPDLNRIAELYSDSDNYKFIAFSASSEKQITKLFEKKKNIKFDYLQIPNSSDLESTLGFQFNPVSFILDGEGTIIYMEVGYTPENISNMEKVLEDESKKMLTKYKHH